MYNNSWAYYGQPNNRRTDESRFQGIMSSQQQQQQPLSESPMTSYPGQISQQSQLSQRQTNESQRLNLAEDLFRRDGVSSSHQSQQQHHPHQSDNYFQNIYPGQTITNPILPLNTQSQHQPAQSHAGQQQQQTFQSVSTAPTTYALSQTQQSQYTPMSPFPALTGQRSYYTQSQPQQPIIGQSNRSLSYYSQDLQQKSPQGYTQRYESIDQLQQPQQHDSRLLPYGRTLSYPTEQQRTPIYSAQSMTYGSNFLFGGRSSIDGTANPSELSTLDPTPQHSFEQLDGSESSSSHFKPPQPKQNTRPRINKLSSEQYVVKTTIRKPTFKLGEYSTRELKQIFFNHCDIVIHNNHGGDRSFYFESKIKTDFELQMFDYFVNSVSNIIDVYFDKRIYAEIVSEIALFEETNIILNAIFCLSSLMLHRLTPNKVDPSLPIKYYQNAVKIIKYHLESNLLEDGIASRCLLATSLLCLYEFFFSSIQGIYLDNATNILASIIGAKTRNKSSALLESPFLGTCFWGIFLMGFIQSLKNGQMNTYSVEKFWKSLDSEYFKIFDKYSLLRENEFGNEVLANMETVWWFRKTILNCSKILDFKHEIIVLSKEDIESNKQLIKWVELKNMIMNFEQRISPALEPVVYKQPSNDDDDEDCFPMIYFKDELSALIGLNRSLAKILLFESLLKTTKIHSQMFPHQLARFPPNYCKKLANDMIGIIQTYDSNLAIWPLNLHIIRHVGHYLQDDPNVAKQLDSLVERMLMFCKLTI
ncbi:uncharacterized protein J8A68_003031 [[Candida] subhashii]|uniref:Transcription factor domain-containing protein n=1 Tax=[Candida] subhashii TaxID=561895 RepID=A0A8J5UZD8_9ASCO|nr:uncharacterized protein J8A68_003031 [[Candida] subhashii]KAG7663484.1 hypothetical protein J8A68_003031 [[Candida] subhashii]